jgi:iron complex transport system ATP-binding protein
VLLERALVPDEPTSHRDIRCQLELMDIVRTLGLTTVAVLHDLNLAAAFCDRLHVLLDGRMVASGEPREVLNPALL